MGVYIDGLEMPKSCNKCPFTCEALQFFNGKGRPQSCPLIEIGDIEYQAYKEFRTMLLKKIEDRILYGERRADDKTEESRP